MYGGGKSPSESNQFIVEGCFETVYCNSDGVVSKKIKNEVEDEEMDCLGDVGELQINSPKWKCEEPECQEMFITREKMLIHLKQCPKRTGKNSLYLKYE